MSDLPTNSELRERFKEVYPDISVIKQVDLHRLQYYLDEELEQHYQDGGLRMYMMPINLFVIRMIRSKGLQYRGLELKVNAHYFECGREAITFTPDGNVYFCGWVGGTNYIPFIKAFIRWLDYKQGIST